MTGESRAKVLESGGLQTEPPFPHQTGAGSAHVYAGAQEEAGQEQGQTSF